MAIIAKYSLNGNANDSAGSNNGVSTNVTWVDGKINGAGSFSGASNNEITFGSGLSNVFGGRNNRTVTGLFKIDKTNSTLLHFTSNTGGSWTARSLSIFFFSTNLTIERAGGGVNDALSATFSPSGINYLSFTYDGTTLRIYIGGVLVNSSTSTLSANNATAYRGLGLYRGEGAVIRPYQGTMDEVEIHNTALTPAEIKNKALFYNGFI